MTLNFTNEKELTQAKTKYVRKLCCDKVRFTKFV